MRLELEHTQEVKPQAKFMPNLEVFPLQGRQLPDLGILDQAYQTLTTPSEVGDAIGRIFFKLHYESGNAGAALTRLPPRYYTLTTKPDNLFEFQDTYPDEPTKRYQMGFAFHVPTTDESRHFQNTARIRVQNHLTGRVFYSVEARSFQDGEWLVYDKFYYENRTWDDRVYQNQALYESPKERERKLDLLINWEMDKTKPFPKEIEERNRDIKLANEELSYSHPFYLCIINNPEVIDRIGVTIEVVSYGTVDLHGPNGTFKMDDVGDKTN